MTKESAMVTLAGKSLAHHVFLPQKANIATVATALKAVLSQGKSFEPGEAAADLVASVSPAIRCRLIFPSAFELTEAAGKAVRRFNVRQSGGEFHVSVHNGGVTEYDGPLDVFLKWAEKFTGLEGIIGKVVQFVYSTGTGKGTRTVKVGSVSRDPHYVYIDGLDLEVPDLKEAQRRYNLNNVVGEINVLN
jgi:hypothetical protein